MPFVLLIIGAVLLISAARGTTQQGQGGGPGLFTLIESDFTGQNNFIFWLLAILAIGAVGYVPKLKPFSVGFLTLVIIVLFLKRGNPSGVGGGFFAQFTQGVGVTQSAAPSVNQTPGAASGVTPTATGLSSLIGSNLLSVGGYNSSLYGPTSSTADTTGQNGSDVFQLPGIDNSPVATSGSQGLDLSSLTPAPSSTDVSFPSLGIG